MSLPTFVPWVRLWLRVSRSVSFHLFPLRAGGGGEPSGSLFCMPCGSASSSGACSVAWPICSGGGCSDFSCTGIPQFSNVSHVEQFGVRPKNSKNVCPRCQTKFRSRTREKSRNCETKRDGDRGSEGDLSCSEEEMSSEEEEGRKDAPTSLIKDMSVKWNEHYSFVELYHLDKAATSRAVNAFNDEVMSHFRKVLKRRQKQVTLDMFFKKRQEHPTAESSEPKRFERERSPLADLPEVFMEEDSPSKQ